ncbi:MAG: hypothetical protein M3P04_13660 [Actinomycetota bacterium]|nr:hypothetical protein [Actinomycetota bacterium]
MSPLRRTLAESSAVQGGAFTTAQAHAAGFTRHAITAAVRGKAWRRLAKGVFVEEARWAAMDPRARHRCLLHARLLVLDESWFAARRSAAVVHDLPLIGALPGKPQLVRNAVPGVGTASTGYERVASLDGADVHRGAEPRRTSLARTVVDLAREEDFRSAVVVADAALRRGVGAAELYAVATRSSGWPGVARALRVLDFADGLAESPLESISRVAHRQCDIPRPELQVEIWVGARRVARVDNLWRGVNLVGEADGAGKYGSTADLYAEKGRQDEIEELGLEVVRWGWDDAWRPRGRLDVKVRAAMERGLRRTVDPRVRFVPVTVQELLGRAA